MSALSLWLRRSSARYAILAMGVLSVLLVTSRTGWQWEWKWAMSWASGVTIVVSPLVAGMVAFDVQRYLTPTVSLLTSSSRRGARGLLALALSMYLAALAAWLLAVGYAAVRVAMAGGTGAPTMWVFLHAPAALAAAALFGLMVGVVVPNLAAGPVAAISAYVVPLALLPFGLTGVLAAGGATGSLIGTEPNPPVAATLVIANLTLAAAFLAIATARVRTGRPTRWAPAALASAVALASLTALSSLDPQTSLLRPMASEPVCVGSSTRVCGPQDAARLLTIAAHDLDSARESLDDKGFTTVHSYSMVAGSSTPGAGTGILSVTPEEITGGRLGSWDVALTIATPSACEEYYGSAPPTGLLDIQGRLSQWLMRELETDASSEADLESALQTYDALKECDPSRAPHWEFVE